MWHTTFNNYQGNTAPQPIKLKDLVLVTVAKLIVNIDGKFMQQETFITDYLIITVTVNNWPMNS